MRTPKFKPGDHVRWFAERMGWEIAPYNILVEGENDKKYFELANQLYWEQHGRHLIGTRLSIFPTGIGDQGGAYGIHNYFPTFRHIITIDSSEEGKRLFHAIALLDKDPIGIYTLRALTGTHTNIKENRDIFLLYRKYPRTTRNHEHLTSILRKENEKWKNLHCEIEDLINYDLLIKFSTANYDSTERKPELLNGAHHFKFRKHAKAPLFRFIKENANLGDLSQIIETLKSFRYYFNLDPEGE